MTLQDIYLLSPEISLAGLALIIVVLDVFIKNKILVQSVIGLGLLVPVILSVLLWNGIGIQAELDSNNQVFGLFNTLVVDKFTLLFKFLFLGILSIVMISSVSYAHRFEKTKMEYFSLLMFATVGMMLLASTRELITIYISLELTALPMAVLISISGNKLSSESGIKFLILSAISSALLLYGMVWVYGLTGTTDVAEIFHSIEGMSRQNGDLSNTAFGNYGLLLGVILIVAGFGFKISSVPFHMWVPDVYQGAPTPITAFLSVASKAAGFAVILRVFYGSFSSESLSIEWSMIFAIMAVLSMAIGNFVAISQKNIKRLLAYSTIAHAGYIMMGVVMLSSAGLKAMMFYLGAYLFMNLGAFLVVIILAVRLGSEDIKEYQGLGWRSPWIALAMTGFLFSLTGLPPTAGFIGKIYLFASVIEGGLYWLAVVGVLNSAVSLYYYARIVRTMYLEAPLSEERISIPSFASITLVLLFAGTLILGIYWAPLADLAERSTVLFRG